MAGTAMKALIFIASILVGVGITLFATSLIPGLDDTTKIILGIVVVLATFVCFYSVTKSSGG